MNRRLIDVYGVLMIVNDRRRTVRFEVQMEARTIGRVAGFVMQVRERTGQQRVRCNQHANPHAGDHSLQSYACESAVTK